MRGSAPRKLLQKIVVERWGTWRARLGTSSCCGPVGTALLKAPARIRCFVRLVCCFAWLEHESCCCSSVSKALLHGTSSCCGPVGTALPKAPARIRCFVQLVCGFAWFGHYFFLFKLFKWVPKATFRHFSGCGFAMAWAQNLLGFCLFACASQTPFSWVWSGGLQASKSYVAQRFALLEATFFFVFSRFQKQRFGIFLFSAFFVGSKSNVSAVFWLRFRM